MAIFDAHCDVLMKLWLNKYLSFNQDPALHVTYKEMKQTGAKVQLFAIYIPEGVPCEHRFDVALEMIHLFYTKVLIKPKMKLVRSKKDLDQLKEDEIGAILTLEGCDAIGHSLIRLQTLLRLGVKSIGLTWNYSNDVADGILEERGAGLSSFGKEVVNENNKEKVWTDVSHLSVKGFWDVMDHANYVIASHSNVYRLCSNPRNLNDDQIRAIIKKNGVMGITFVPEFLNVTGEASLKDVLNHIEYICALGGECHMGFGSDFDGIDKTVYGLHSYRNYEQLINELDKHYSATQVQGFLYDNFAKRLP
ncbi:dipeptidase [Bacillus sp. CGMCC 1.16541]|uniref:dipeptidase n=1 Tax=Bacillus sp. CGMCC 1.16541 TaxID=2185143 RepID=UPI000D73A057|nr:dipeptidase [Bacillus sp. CGMCC 1.16541]